MIKIHPLTYTNRLKIALSLWLVLALVGHFTLGILEQSAYVLCFGADGHVAVERAGHDHRALNPRCFDQISADKNALQNADPACVDIPVDDNDHGSHTPFPEPGKGFDGMAWAAALIAFYFVLLPLARTVSAAFRPHSPPLLDSRILLRRSVVLLI